MLNYQRVLHPFPTVPHGSLPCLFSSADGGDGSAEADGIPTGLRDGGWGRFHCRSAPICKGGCQRQRYMMIRYDKSWYIHIYSKISGYMNYIWYTMYIRTYIYTCERELWKFFFQYVFWKIWSVSGIWSLNLLIAGFLVPAVLWNCALCGTRGVEGWEAQPESPQELDGSEWKSMGNPIKVI